MGYPPYRGTPPGQVRWGGVTQGGVPPTPVGVPPSQVQWGVPEVGYPHRGTPQLDLAGVPPPRPGRGTPPPRCGQTEGWMDGQTRVKT